MKLATNDTIAILQKFNVADTDARSREIDQLKVSHPTDHTTLASFRFHKQLYYLLVDITAEDDTNYLKTYIDEIAPGNNGEFMTNPNEESLASFAVPFKGKEAYLFKVAATKKRLDVYLSELYPETSRSTWQKYIKAGYVSVDEEGVTSSKQDVSGANNVAVAIPDATDYSNQDLPIVYIDDDIIVINKPVGVLTHAKGALSDEFTVADFFKRYTTYGLETNRPGIVHRLDRDTSGIMVGARTPEVATLLQKQFADRKVKKTYLAILEGILKEKEATIDLPIGRNPSLPSTFRVDPKGKSAITRYRVLNESNGKTLIQLMPQTGRTHQLRVHMNYLHAPILGDRVYGKQSNRRLYLHAHQLELTMPSGERKVFLAPTPSSFKQLFPDVS
ncbi:MAG TPA: RluA family pseudouridine synthase [Candidatus Saccharimonadales bacterium]|nr:RluA family pseudouridine synthase [Candidatus Saccharimonadales bacterium]